MDDLVNELMKDFDTMSLSEQNKIKTFTNSAININDKTCVSNDDINCLISEFTQLELVSNCSVKNKFYFFILKQLNKDRKYFNSFIFIPPEPPTCK